MKSAECKNLKPESPREDVMKFLNWRAVAIAAGGLLSNGVLAHPGHVHGGGTAHGLSWTDWMVYLLAAVAVPGAARVVAWLRDRRPSHRRH
jgi:hypothetical protein